MGIILDLCQDNHSMSKEIGTIRGLHYQIEPMEMTKIVRVVRGEILDVIVDIRKGSPTFGEWASFHLTSDNRSRSLSHLDLHMDSAHWLETQRYYTR